MSSVFLLIVVFLPILAGALLPLFVTGTEEEQERKRKLYVAVPVLLNTLLVFLLIFFKPKSGLTLLHLTEHLTISFRMDGLASVFAGLVAGLWPLASSYAFEYMEHEEQKNKFFALYTMTYGVTIGIATSANLVTMYLFYELLTLVTLPLVMHSMDNRSIKAGVKYLTYSIGGAAAAFAGMMILMNVGDPSLTFTYGGFIPAQAATDNRALLSAGYLLCFFGFGVKAAVFPFHSWLPDAGVAPTPVTALLHAVAVVKAGVFAIMRSTYFCFGMELFSGTWVQAVAMLFASFTIVYGSTMAWKEQHIKRRLAYSTVSNLSYIAFGATLMSAAGFQAAMTHMVFHGIMKITLFFCAGAVMHQTHREYVPQLYGMGHSLKVVFFAFTVGSIALTGVPLLCGFVSKWMLATAATDLMNPYAVWGVSALLISAVLTAAYTLTIVVRAYFPGRDFDMTEVRQMKDPTNYMKIPLLVLCAFMLIFGLFSTPLTNALYAVATGLI